MRGSSKLKLLRRKPGWIELKQRNRTGVTIIAVGVTFLKSTRSADPDEAVD